MVHVSVGYGTADGSRAQTQKQVPVSLYASVLILGFRADKPLVVGHSSPTATVFRCAVRDSHVHLLCGLWRVFARTPSPPCVVLLPAHTGDRGDCRKRPVVQRRQAK